MKPGRSSDHADPTDVRLATPSDDHTRSSLSLGVGDLVVYASHGIGRVESTHSSRGDLPETVVVVFESGLRVTLPLTRASQALRTVCRPEELDDVRRTLSADVAPTTEPWSQRTRTIRQTLAEGTVTGLAEVVRDGLLREQRLAAGRLPAPSERELCLQARTLLAAEIAACRGIEEAAADAWIVQQVSGESPQR